MSMLLYKYLLGHHQSHPTKNMASQTHERRRLQKSPRGPKFQKELYSRKEVLDVLRNQSVSATLTQNHHYEYAPEPPIELVGSSPREFEKPHVDFYFENQQDDNEDCDSINDSVSMYSAQENFDPLPRRLRSKTPVHFVGQLESNSLRPFTDPTQNLAEDYQSQLPPRAFTPFCEAEIPKYPPHKLRKIKCQVSLRDLVKADQCKRTSSGMYSDADTLVGSERSSSFPSPIEEKCTSQHSSLASLDGRSPHVTQQYSEVVAEIDHNIGLKICADLLTNELVSALYRHHPAELDDRASGLQILLMIEAHERVQEHIRELLYDNGGDEKHFKMVDEILDHWLQVLYGVYDRSQEKGESEGRRRSCDQDEFERLRLMPGRWISESDR